MAQISRPFQIAFLAVVLLAGVWLFALRGHSSSPSSSGSAAVAPTSSTPAQSAAPTSTGANAGAPSPIYKGAAPGVGGLSRAIAKAHGAVATSQQNAKELQEKSTQASSTAAPATAGTPSASTTTGTSTAPSAMSVKPAPATRPSGAARSHTLAVAPLQRTVESELKAGSVVVLLVWNPKGAEDAIVHRELLALAALHRHYAGSKTTGPNRSGKGLHTEFGQPIAIHSATPGQVTSFGSFTREVQIFSTPTVLVVNKRGQVRTLTGAPGMLSIEQATDEARHP